MHTRTVRRYVIVPVVYLAAIFGLLFLQFSGTLTVRRSIGELRFAGTLVSGADETSTEITAARVEYEGLVFEFSDDRPLRISNQTVSDMALIPRHFDLAEDGVLLEFSDGSALRFQVASLDPPELQIVPAPTTEWPMDGHLVLPYDTSGNAIITGADETTPEVRTVMYDEREFFLSAPPRTRFEDGQEQLIIPLSAGTQMVRYAEVTAERTNVIELAFGEGQRRVPTATYQSAIDDYLELGYEGWGGGRFNGGSGTWTMRDRAPRFSEDILVAYLAEAWERNEYTPAFNQMRRAADLHPEQVGFLSSVFLGDLRNVTSSFVAADEQRALSLISRIRGNDPTVFREEDLISFSALRGNEDLYQAVLDFARTVDYRTVGMPTAIGMLSASVDQLHPSEEAAQATARFRGVVEERILPAVRQFEDFFFVETAQSEVDVYWSIRAGQLLNEVGRVDGNELYRTVGRNLVLSGLQLVDQQGFLPEFLFFNEAGLQGREGSFGPERLYPHFTDNIWYPRMISLYEELGAGSFIWTIAPFTQVDVAANQSQFRLRYPQNRTHYIIMHGIPPFDSMNLFGLQWRNDPRFESYIKGRHYEGATRTLMIKYTDPTVEGTITLFY